MLRKKLLHFQLVPILSGPQNVMFHILESLPRDDFDVYVMSQPGIVLSDEVKRRGFNFIPLNYLKHQIHIYDAVVFIQLIFLFRKHRFDIVHTHSSKPGLLGRIAAKIARVPLIIHTGHGAPFHYGQSPLEYRFYIEMERFGARFGDKLVFVNQYLKDYYISRKMIDPLRAVTIYNALSNNLISQLAEASQKRHPNPGCVTIGSILRFTPAKNIVKTISAAIHICLARSDIRFIFVGDGKLFTLCRKMVETHSLHERIILPGWKDNPVEQYALFDAFLLYSIFEGLPMCVIEAMYAGLPIIGSDIPGIAELVDNTNGWLIPADNLPVLEASLHKIIDDRIHFAEKGTAARIKAECLCSYDTFVRGYQALYYGEKA